MDYRITNTLITLYFQIATILYTGGYLYIPRAYWRYPGPRLAITMAIQSQTFM